MVRVAAFVALLLLGGCESFLSQQGHVPSYRHPFVTQPSNAEFEPPNSLPR